MSRSGLCTALLLTATLAGIGWTIAAWLWGVPEWATCLLIFPACQRRPILTGAWFLLLLGLSWESLRGGVTYWRLTINGAAWAASGHLHWPHT